VHAHELRSVPRSGGPLRLAFTEWPDGFDWRQAGVIMDDGPQQTER
jgi:hypothetical protein